MEKDKIGWNEVITFLKDKMGKFEAEEREF